MMEPCSPRPERKFRIKKLKVKGEEEINRGEISNSKA